MLERLFVGQCVSKCYVIECRIFFRVRLKIETASIAKSSAPGS